MLVKMGFVLIWGHDVLEEQKLLKKYIAKIGYKIDLLSLNINIHIFFSFFKGGGGIVCGGYFILIFKIFSWESVKSKVS